MMAAHPAPVSFLRGGGKALKAVSDPQRGPTKFFSQGKKTLWPPNLHGAQALAKNDDG